MNNSELQNLWQSSDAIAERHYLDLQPEIKTAYRKKGLKEYRYVKIYHWLGFGVSLLGFLAYLYICFFKPGFFGIGNPDGSPFVGVAVSLILFVGYWTLSFRQYTRLNRAIESCAVMDIKSSLTTYMESLKKHRVRQINLKKAVILIMYILYTIASFAAGESIISNIISLVLIVPFELSVAESIYDYFYKDSETELKILIQQLSLEK